jgi:hypothetical protein
MAAVAAVGVALALVVLCASAFVLGTLWQRTKDDQQ